MHGRMGIKRTGGWEGCKGRMINRMIGGWEGVLRMERWIRIEGWKEEMKDGICGRKTGRINERKEG